MAKTIIIPRRGPKKRGVSRFKHPNNVLLQKNRPSPKDDTVDVDQILESSKKNLIKKNANNKAKIPKHNEDDESFTERYARKRGQYKKVTSEVKKQIINLRFKEGLSYKLIEKKTKVNQSTAKVICNQAKNNRRIHISAKEAKVRSATDIIIKALDERIIPQELLVKLKEKIIQNCPKKSSNVSSQTQNQINYPQQRIYQQIPVFFGMHPMMLRSTFNRGPY